MKSTQLLASLAAVSVIVIASACSSSSDSKGDGGGDETGGSSGAGGSATGGSSGSATGGKGGSTGGKGGSTGGSAGSSSGGSGDTDGGQEPDSSAGTGGTSTEGGTSTGGAPATCPGKNTFTDPENCGSCGKSCAGGRCLDGVCEATLVMDAEYQVYGPNSYAGFVSGDRVYEWEYTTANPANNADSLVLSAPSKPGDPVSKGDVVQDIVVNAGDVGIDAVAFDATYVWETIEGTPVGAKGLVARKKLDRSENTGAGTKVFTLPAGPTNPDGNKPSNLQWKAIAVGADGVYVAGTTNINGPFNPNPDHTSIYRMAAPLPTDATKEPVAVVTGRGQVITDLSVFGNATSGQHLFWLEYNPAKPDNDAGPGTDYFIFTVPVTGGTPVELGDVNTSAGAIASDGTYVYWTEHNSLGRLMRVPLNHLGDASKVEAVADLDNAQEGLAVLGKYVFAMEFTDPGPVFRIDTTDGTKEQIGYRTIGASEKETAIIGVDANFLYMTGLDAKIFRVPNVP